MQTVPPSPLVNLSDDELFERALANPSPTDLEHELLMRWQAALDLNAQVAADLMKAQGVFDAPPPSGALHLSARGSAVLSGADLSRRGDGQKKIVLESHQL